MYQSISEYLGLGSRISRAESGKSQELGTFSGMTILRVGVNRAGETIREI